MREAIIRGVYEDNLRIIGKRRTTIYRRRFHLSKRLLLIIFIAAAGVLDYGQYLTPAMHQDRQVAANIITEVPPLQSPSPSDELSDYKALMTSRNMPVSRMFGLDVRTIMIDPGHGGADSGTTGKMGTKEKDITLDIAKRLKRLLERQGSYVVVLTREEDITLPLSRRVELAHQSKADIFISVHLNYLPSKPINIIETYYFGPTSDPAALELAEQENAGSHNGFSDLKEIIEKMGKTFRLMESREFAASIQRNLYRNIRRENEDSYDFGIKRAPFVVLRGVDVPAVLAEVSCLSNREEEARLSTETYREDVARYLEAGILSYLHNKGVSHYEAKRDAERG